MFSPQLATGSPAWRKPIFAATCDWFPGLAETKLCQQFARYRRLPLARRAMGV
jgi:hypothetical protein